MKPTQAQQQQQYQDINPNFFMVGKNDDDQQAELPLLPLNSRFSVTSSMNPVRGLEMKRLISVNQDGAAEPYIDLGANYLLSYNQNGQQPQLLNQQSFMPDLTNQQTNYFSNYNNQSVNFDLLNPSFLDASSFQNTLAQAAPRNIPAFFQQTQQQNQQFAQNQQQQQQQSFFGTTGGNNRNNLSILQNNNNNNNLLFKNPDQLSTTNATLQNTFLRNNNNNGFANSLSVNQLQQIHQQQQHLQHKEFQEKKEELENDSNTTGLQLSNEQIKSLTTLQQQQNQLQQFQNYNNNPHQIFNLSQFQQQNHQQYINREEAEYLNEAKSHVGEDPANYQSEAHLDDQFPQDNNRHANHEEDDDDGYSNNMDSHTRNKTEWPTRQKGQTKYQQCRHRNIFKNFGNIFRKFVSFHQHFTDKALIALSKDQESLKVFQRWLKKDIRLENKKDFIEGWTVWSDEDPQIRIFKILLKELSRDFFQDYILIYLLNSKLQDLEIHLRSIGPCLAAINVPSILYKFRPI